MKKSYHSMVVPIMVPATTRRSAWLMRWRAAAAPAVLGDAIRLRSVADEGGGDGLRASSRSGALGHGTVRLGTGRLRLPARLELGKECGEFRRRGQRQDIRHVLVGAHHHNGATAVEAALFEDVRLRVGAEDVLVVSEPERTDLRLEHCRDRAHVD